MAGRKGNILIVDDNPSILTSLEILQPNLESVFLHLTGKSLRQ